MITCECTDTGAFFEHRNKRFNAVYTCAHVACTCILEDVGSSHLNNLSVLLHTSWPSTALHKREPRNHETSLSIYKHFCYCWWYAFMLLLIMAYGFVWLLIYVLRLTWNCLDLLSRLLTLFSFRNVIVDFKFNWLWHKWCASPRHVLIGWTWITWWSSIHEDC